VALASEGWIMKTAGSDYPAITRNEYFCLLAARNSGMRVPQFELSDDRRVLAVRRFDIEGEVRLGFEDMGVLQGLGTAEKYSGTWERILRSIEDYFPPELRQPARRELFKMLAFSLAIRSDDAHLKNFGVLYTRNSDIRLAPVYDVVTTLAYDEFRDNSPALSFLGKKTWIAGPLLARFGRNTCKLSDAEIRTLIEEIQQGLTQTAELVAQAATQDAEFREVGKRMLSLWAEGAGSLADQKIAVPVPEILAASNRHKLSDRKPRARKRNDYKDKNGPFSSKAR
jgi:serine/threonine-protein kinase HipA